MQAFEPLSTVFLAVLNQEQDSGELLGLELAPEGVLACRQQLHTLGYDTTLST